MRVVALSLLFLCLALTHEEVLSDGDGMAAAEHQATATDLLSENKHVKEFNSFTSAPECSRRPPSGIELKQCGDDGNEDNGEDYVAAHPKNTAAVTAPPSFLLRTLEPLHKCDELAIKQPSPNIVYYSLSNIQSDEQKLSTFLSYQHAMSSIYTMLTLAELECILRALDRSYVVELNCLASALLANKLRLSSALPSNSKARITATAIDVLLAKIEANYLGFYTHQIRFLRELKNAFFYYHLFIHADPVTDSAYFYTLSQDDVELILAKAASHTKTRLELESKAEALMSADSKLDIARLLTSLLNSSHALDDMKDLFVAKLAPELLPEMPIQVKKYIFLRNGLTFKLKTAVYNFTSELDLIVDALEPSDIPLIDSLLANKAIDMKALVSEIIGIFEVVPGKRRFFLARVNLSEACEWLDPDQVQFIFFHAPNLEWMAKLTVGEFQRVSERLAKRGFDSFDVVALAEYLESTRTLISSHATHNPLYGIKLFEMLEAALAHNQKRDWAELHRLIRDRLFPCVAPLLYKTFAALDPTDMVKAFFLSSSYDAEIYTRIQIRDLYVMYRRVSENSSIVQDYKLQDAAMTLCASLSMASITLSSKCAVQDKAVKVSLIQLLDTRFPQNPLTPLLTLCLPISY